MSEQFPWLYQMIFQIKKGVYDPHMLKYHTFNSTLIPEDEKGSGYGVFDPYISVNVSVS